MYDVAKDMGGEGARAVLEQQGEWTQGKAECNAIEVEVTEAEFRLLRSTIEVSQSGTA